MAVAICPLPLLHYPHPHDMYYASRPGQPSCPAPAYVPLKVHAPARRGPPFEVSLSAPFFDYVVDRLVDTVTASLDPVWRVEQSISLKEPRLRWWVEEVITKSRCRTSTVLVALTYLDRARPNMRISLGAWACERALIGSLILANKYTNDEVFSTRAWAHASQFFAPRDVVRAERELLQVLRFDLQINTEALASHYQAIVARSTHPTFSTVAIALRPPPSQPALPMASSSRHPRFVPNPMPSIHALRRTSVESTLSSGSASPLDSPELQTPESYPFNAATHGPSDAKRTYPPVSYVAPYVLAHEKRDVYSQDFTSIPVHNDSRPYLLAGGKDFGDAFAPSQPSLLAELYEDLDPQFIPHLHAAEVGPSFPTHNLPPLPPHLLDIPHQYVENTTSWMDVSPAAQNSLPYVF